MAVFCETSVFTRRVTELLPDDDYAELQRVLVDNPNAGDLIPGSGGLRKIRWAAEGRGKRGGESGRGTKTMNDELFGDLMASIEEAGRIARDETAASRTFTVERVPLDVAGIREGYKLSQNRFAALLGISVKTLRNWEQGRRAPVGPARVLLLVAAKHPDAVWDVVREASRGGA